MARTDPWLSERMRADARIRRGERNIYQAVITAMTIWLDTTRQLILGQPVPALTASSGLLLIPETLPPHVEDPAADQAFVEELVAALAGDDALLADAGNPDPIPDIDAAQASFAAWARALENHVEPAIAEAFGEAFAAQSRAADISPVHFQEHHMATVHDRLKIWPEGAFEELRPELLEAMQQNESIEQITDRIGRILDIDAPSRRIRADISAIDAQIADPATDRDDLPFLRGKRRRLWNQHDESQQQWKWLARRIARTEIQGAVEGGSLASAQATAEATGEEMYKAWLSTSDERTRASHNVADGQIVKLAEPFRVGVALLMHPAFPGGPAHEVINCRCTMRILTYSEMQTELQGMWGGRGVSPMGARLGPDDEADAATAIDRLNRERRGEVLDPIERTEPDERIPDDSKSVVDEAEELDLPDPDDIPELEDDRPDDSPADPVGDGYDDEIGQGTEDPAADSDVDDRDLEDQVDDADDELHVADEEPDLDTDDEELPDHPAVEGDPADDSDNETEPEVHQPDTDPADIPDVEEEPAPPPAPTESVILEPIIETTPTPEPLVFGDLEVDEARRWASRSWPLDRNSFDPEVSRAVTQYTGDYHDVMNESLRGEFLTETSEANQRMVANLRRAIDEAPRVPEPVHVFREVSSVAAFELPIGANPRALLGEAITDLGFMSTSLTQATAGAADVDGSAIMVEIAVPAGYAAIYVSGTTSQQADDILSAFGNAEVELILRDGTTIVVTGINRDARGRPILQAEVIDTTEGE
ncbi:ADP-ribosyltransferase [Rhodococcus sp. JT-3]|uniref:ADP-ribosyltransferase n=1 Tax=Rhodococcus sp. JT-3 TaxID=1973213 RepID=UPI001303705A|nr:ADP-ribosyltransferase [Rhodococcus sp. JT-3]